MRASSRTAKPSRRPGEPATRTLSAPADARQARGLRYSCAPFVHISAPCPRMQKVTIWHNPRCSKSRETLALLQERHIEPEIVEYLKDTPSQAEIERTLKRL